MGGVDLDQNVLTFLACICFLFLVGKIFIVPIKTVLKLILNSILGGFLIIVINIIGGVYGFHIGLNLVTAICIGLLGIPRCSFINFIKNNNIKIGRGMCPSL